jgi:hypothetical protein
MVFSNLGIETYPDQLEPSNQNTPIWRFINLRKFRDLMEAAELYFCRADLFPDEREGLPPEEYLATFGLHPDVNDRRELLNHIGSDAQFREGFYVNCWYLFREETNQMWKEYGNEGVAITSWIQNPGPAIRTGSLRSPPALSPLSDGCHRHERAASSVPELRPAPLPSQNSAESFPGGATRMSRQPAIQPRPQCVSFPDTFSVASLQRTNIPPLETDCANRVAAPIVSEWPTIHLEPSPSHSEPGG